MQRTNWCFVGLFFLVLLLAACGTTNQPVASSSPSTTGATATSTPASPSDANPVLSIPAQVADTPTDTPIPASTSTPTPPAPAPTRPAARPTSPPVTSAPPTSGGNTEGQLQQQLFQRINQDRAAQGLYAYSLNSTMSNGARQHSITMSGSCGMSHQCPGEPDPCTRVSNEGISWTACGENVGYTSPNPTNWAGVQNIDQQMLNEQPPEDGHRRNLLSASYHRVGVGIYIDSRGYIWITEDFAD